MLGLGVSGPQVVEGWYGQPSNKPLARTREYVEIIRRVLAREEPLDFQGEFYQHPYRGPGSVGPRQAAQVDHPPAAPRPPDLPRRRGPEERGQTAEIADGWLPLYYSPFHQDVYADSLAGAEGRTSTSWPACQLNITDDVEAGPRPGEDDARLLHRRHGRQGPELPHQAHGAVRLRGGGAQDPGALLRGPPRRGHRRGARRVRRRHLAVRPARRASASASQAWEDSPVSDAARLLPRPRRPCAPSPSSCSEEIALDTTVEHDRPRHDHPTDPTIDLVDGAFYGNDPHDALRLDAGQRARVLRREQRRVGHHPLRTTCRAIAPGPGDVLERGRHPPRRGRRCR